MADLWRKEGEQFFDDSGNVLAGGVLRYFDAGTSNGKTVYQDDGEAVAHGTSVTLNSAGRLSEAIYIATGDFKETLEDSAASSIFENDNIPGALDLSSYLTSSTFSTPVLAKTADYTVVSGDSGKVIQANPTGGDFEITLPNAATVGDGFRIHVIHTGTANNVSLKPVSSQLIAGEGGQVLTFYGQAANLVSDGAGWQIDNLFGPQLYQRIQVVSRTLLTPPASPTPGAWYQLPASGTLLSGWASFSNNDLVQANGQGGWIQFTPGSDDEGLIIDILAEETQSRWNGVAWTVDSGVGLVSRQEFTSSGTWTRPDGVSKIIVEVVGGGGGAGNAIDAGSNAHSCGGGGGGYARKLINVTEIDSVTVTIGAGGNGGDQIGVIENGGDGGTTSFGSHCSATGGEGSNGESSTTGTLADVGYGGQGSNGDFNGRGFEGGNATSAGGGYGGGTVLSAGAASQPNGDSDGNNALANTGGGGGGAYKQTGGTDSGGDGADGICIVWEYK